MGTLRSTFVRPDLHGWLAAGLKAKQEILPPEKDADASQPLHTVRAVLRQMKATITLCS